MDARGTRRLAIAHVIASLSALPASGVFVTLGSATFANSAYWAAWRLCREGGGYTWLVGFTFIGVAIALGVLGHLSISGRRVPKSTLYGIALLPFLVGGACAIVNHAARVSMLDRESVDDDRMFAFAASQTESTIILGATFTATAMLVVALAALFRVLATDAQRVVSSNKRRASIVATAAAMLMVLAAAITTRVLLNTLGHPLSLLVLFGALGIGVLAASRAPIPAARDDVVEPEYVESFRALILLALAMASSAIFAGAAAYAVAKSDVLGSISVETESSGRLLLEAASRMRVARLLSVLDASLLFIGLAVPAIASRPSRASLQIRCSFVAWPAMLLLSFGLAAAQARLVKRDAPGFQHIERLAAVDGSDVPITRERWDLPERLQPTLIVSRAGLFVLDGDVTRQPIPATQAALANAVASRPLWSRPRDGIPEHLLPKLALVVDRGMTYGELKIALAPALDMVDSFSLILQPPGDMRTDRGPLGDLAPFLGTEARAATLRFYWRPETGQEHLSDGAPPILTVTIDGASATIRREGTDSLATTPIPMGRDEASRAARRAAFDQLARGMGEEELGIVPKEKDTLETIWELADDARSAFPSAPRVTLISDCRGKSEHDADATRDASVVVDRP